MVLFFLQQESSEAERTDAEVRNGEQWRGQWNHRASETHGDSIAYCAWYHAEKGSKPNMNLLSLLLSIIINLKWLKIRREMLLVF